VVDRFGQIEPVLLFAVDGYRYGDKVVDRRQEVKAISERLPSLRTVVSIPYLGVGEDDWSPMVATGVTDSADLIAVPFDHPLYVLYSSGTTGLPKAIVHGHGGITLEHLKVLQLHQDLRPDDRFFWFTTTGWMMWNYLVSGLLTGASIVLADCDPGHPDLGKLWRIAEEERVTIFGTSAPFLMACRKAAIEPNAGALRWIGSTGAPLPKEGFRWIHETIGVPVSSISGGTDVCSAFVGTSPLLPIRAGEMSCRLLGCAVEAYDEDGRPCAPGVTGELVITAPMPSMPVGLWGDVSGDALRAAYFARFPGVWRHGDWIAIAGDGACTISGRSDATLNRGGVRLGTSEFYAVVDAFDEIIDSLVVHLEDSPRAPGSLILFVVLQVNQVLDDILRERLLRAIRTGLSPRHCPDQIIAAPAVPRTLSGKRLEVPVKRLLHGATLSEVASLGSLVDPAALDFYAALNADVLSHLK
jgi:acetoacetyl-CoA synthetase